MRRVSPEHKIINVLWNASDRRKTRERCVVKMKMNFTSRFANSLGSFSQHLSCAAPRLEKIYSAAKKALEANEAASFRANALKVIFS